ncbi:hypothetical protein ACWF94_12215 [Streptomyces sp. NPDC055078]
MSEEIEKAAREAVEAARNSEQLALIAAVLQAQQLTQTQRPSEHASGRPEAVATSGSALKWLAIGAGGSVFMVAFALSAVAVAIAAVALTICVLVLRGMWVDARKGKG